MGEEAFKGMHGIRSALVGKNCPPPALSVI